MQEIIWFHVVRVACSWCGPLPSRPCYTSSRTTQLMCMPWPGALHLCTVATILWLQPLRIKQSGMLRHACIHCFSMHAHTGSTHICCTSPPAPLSMSQCYLASPNQASYSAALPLMVPQSNTSHNAVEKTRKDNTFRRQFHEKPSTIAGCPGSQCSRPLCGCC